MPPKIISAVKASFIPVDIITSAVSGHEADTGVCLPQIKGKLTDFLLYATGVQYPVRLQGADGAETLFDESVHDVTTCIQLSQRK